MTTGTLLKVGVFVACVLLSALVWNPNQQVQHHSISRREQQTTTSTTETTTTTSVSRLGILNNDASINNNQQQQDIADLLVDDKNDFTNRKVEQRNPVEAHEFFLLASDKPQLPFDVDTEFVVVDDGDSSTSKALVEPLWKCEDTKRSKKLVLVDIAQASEEGDEGDGILQNLLSNYASSCHAGYISVDSCKDLSWDSMISGPGGMWANNNNHNNNNCRVRSVIDRKGKRADMKHAPAKVQTNKKAGIINASILQKYVDVLVGDIPLGCADKWLAATQVLVDDIAVETLVDVQYIVALPSPEAWLIKTALSSSSSSATTEMILKAIRRKVSTGSQQQQHYQELYASYLITPNQHAWIEQERATLTIQQRTNLALANLRDTNALIVLADKQRMKDSTYMIQQLIPRNQDNNHRNLSVAEEELATTTSKEDSQDDILQDVMTELTKDTILAQQVNEYLKYDRYIYKQATILHKQQLKRIRSSTARN